MSVRVVLGAQWGDEGKAKVVDYLTNDSDLVVRYQGGANAGHTIRVDGEEFVFHLIPAGIVRPDKICVIANGVVVDPEALFREIEELQSRGIEVGDRLKISRNAHVVMPYHMVLEKASEEKIGDARIGTTLRGIGPCYRDKVNRSSGIRIGDMLDRDLLPEKIRANVREKNEILTRVYGYEPMDEVPILEAYAAYGERIAPFVTDTSVYLNAAIDSGKRVLFEGSQGTLLDVDHGTYPYVTASNTTAGAACSGSGLGPTKIDAVIGVAKAYSTRVGNGPFPTELADELGRRIRDTGQEYGATTGRPRRCGWFDSVVVRLACRVNGLSSLAITRLDILDELEEIRICTHYEHKGSRLEHFPSDLNLLEACEPVYETRAGWQTPTSHVRTLDGLPENARRYLEHIGELANIPISLVSVGPERNETIVID